MIAVVQFKRCVIETCIFCIVISKLAYWHGPSPVIFVEVGKSLEIRLHGAVLPLGLPVCLQIEGNKKPLLDAEKVAER